MQIGHEGVGTGGLGFYEAMAEGAFGEDTQGRPLFYPWGNGRRGYVIPSHTDPRKIRLAMARLRQARIGTLLLLILALHPRTWLALLALPAYSVAYVVWVRNLTRGWERTPETLSFMESLTRRATSTRPFWLWAGFCLLLVATVVTAADFVINPENWSAAVCAVFFFGPGTILYSWMLLASHRHRRSA